MRLATAWCWLAILAPAIVAGDTLADPAAPDIPSSGTGERESPTPSTPADAIPTPLLHWYAADGSPAWSLGPDTRSPGAGTSIEATPWWPVLPDVEVPGVDGETRHSLEVAPGEVLLIDVWASWCAPCLKELPHLQRLYAELAPSGLRAIAINADEPAEVAARTAEGFGLTMPVGLLPAELERFLAPDALPTVVLVDPEGRVRERWDGYRPGLERTVAERVRALLGEGSRVEPEPIAQVFSGGVDVAWMHRLGAPAEGIAAVASKGRERIVAKSGRGLHSYDADGRPGASVQAPSGMSRIAVGDVTGDGAADLVGYRDGSTRVAVLDLSSGRTASWVAPGVVTDLLPWPQPASVLLATPVGAVFASAQGRILGSLPGAVRSVGPLEAVPEQGGIRVLRPNGELQWIREGAASPQRTDRVEADGDLVWHDASSGYGIAAGEVATWAALPEPHAACLAVATRSGGLWVVDVRDGRVVHRSRWGDGIAQLAVSSGESGIPALAVASGRRVVALDWAFSGDVECRLDRADSARSE